MDHLRSVASVFLATGGSPGLSDPDYFDDDSRSPAAPLERAGDLTHELPAPRLGQAVGTGWVHMHPVLP